MACKTQRRRTKIDALHRGKKSQKVKPSKKIDPITLGDSMQDPNQDNYVPPSWSLPNYTNSDEFMYYLILHHFRNGGCQGCTDRYSKNDDYSIEYDSEDF